MGKRKKFKKFAKLKDQYAVDNINKLMGDLEKALKSGMLIVVDRENGVRLASKYVTTGSVTRTERYKILSIIKKYRKQKRIEIDKKQYLYAVGDGVNVKLGMSCNIKKRMSNMQTANSKKLHLLWKLYVGRDVFRAEAAEKQLHRHCREFKIRGEWFNLHCMLLVANFKIK